VHLVKEQLQPNPELAAIRNSSPCSSMNTGLSFDSLNELGTNSAGASRDEVRLLSVMDGLTAVSRDLRSGPIQPERGSKTSP
jgi:hypothetical protein